jgi:autotransporter-associated beta strand protein
MAVIVCAAVSSRAVTNVWTNASGGYWADEANWQDGMVPNVYSNAVDFTALAPGETVSVTNISAGSLFFSGLPGDVWTLVGTNFRIGQSTIAPVDEPATIRVEGGTLTVQVPFPASMIHGLTKAGSGDLRLTAANSFSGATRLTGGTLFLSNETALLYSPVFFESPDAALVLESDTQVGGLETRCVPPPVVDLGGRMLTVGGEGSTRSFGGMLTNGALVMARGESQTFTATQGIESVRLENGSMNLISPGATITGWWRFDDPAQPGKDSGPYANHLAQTGSQTQWLTADAERGSVLSLDGAGAYLAQAAGGIAALPVSNMPFTVAFWFKPDADVNAAAGLYSWGVASDRHFNMLRLNLAVSGKPLMHTNWGNNRELPSAADLKDGAWHHVAIVYSGNIYTYYLDGAVIDDYTLSAPLNVSSGNFRLGAQSTSTSTFKGLMDDFLVAGNAFTWEQIQALRAAGEVPAVDTAADLLPPSAAVEIAYNGKLRVAGDQTLASLSGAGAAGGVELSGGATLAVGRVNDPSHRFSGSVSGDGTLVKTGASSTLALSGRVTATGGVQLAEGTLALANRLPPGLQAYYRFDDAGDLGKDSSGHGYDLAPSNGPAYASGLFGGAASFSAARRTCFVSTVFPATVPTGNQSYTMAVWCNLAEGGNATGMPVYWGKGNNSSGGSALFRFDSASMIMVANMANNWLLGPGYNLATDAPDGGWHHIACTYDGATRERRVFFNGLPASSVLTNAWDLTIDGQMFWLGGAPYGTANFYDGLLDEVMIFDRALDADEVADVTTGVFSAPWGARLTDNLAAKYSFEDAADLGLDSGPHGLHLAKVGTAAAAAGKIGQALSMNATQQGYLNWTNSVFPEALPTGNAPVTITAWVNPVTNPGKEGSMVFWGTTVTGRHCHLLRIADSGGGRTGFRLVDGSGYIGADRLDAFDRGNGDEGWHHLAAVVGPGGLRAFYVDGALITRGRVTGQTVDPGTFSIGYKPNAPSAWYQGLLDEVTVYGCALSRAEILETLRGRPDILPPDRPVEIASGATLDAGTALQRAAGLTGAGELRIGAGGEVSVGRVNDPSHSVFTGTLAGAGLYSVRDNAAQTLACASSGFGGTIAVSNATLLVGAASGSLVVQSGGLIGTPADGGTFTGNVVFEAGGGIVAGAAPLTVSGPVTLAASGVVELDQPEGFSGGRFPLLSAPSISAPSGLSGWTVAPTPVHFQTRLLIVDGQLVLSVFRSGTLFSVQ